MDIEKLKRKRQKNVQEQIILKKHQIHQESVYWRRTGVAEPVRIILEDKGINPDTSIFIRYDINFPGMASDSGIVLTADHEFFEFELDLNQARTQLMSIDWWQRITEDLEVTNHKPGTGSTKWYLATEVLDELNEA
ncbi:hypothetical protein [Marinicella meishanensis]|uniref:hypothetical protein n=1 Tax=Marinicella meishanensis TaxID=2873263 RepID=UPI001CBE630B|nr:hypothetical protein [Marinicella sp. NBU2979]